MARFGLMTAGVSWLAKSFSALSCTGTLARCTSVLPAAYINPVRCLSSDASSPPKRPLNAYMLYVKQHHQTIHRRYPELKGRFIIVKLAEEWRKLTPEQKQPFQDAAQPALNKFKEDFKLYREKLTPEVLEQQEKERKDKMARKILRRKKADLTQLGKPKRSRTPFNIYYSEHYVKAQRRNAKLSLDAARQGWNKLMNHQKEVYKELAKDDKVRYENEMKVWEDHMRDIGRTDVIRKKYRSGVIAEGTKRRMKILAEKEAAIPWSESNNTDRKF